MDPCPILVGRQQELAALRALLDAGGGAAIVSGEAGIGKSRLIREFAKEAEERGRLVLWARPEEVAQPGPYALIVDLLESIAERGGKEIQTEARALAAELTGAAELDGQRPAPAARTVAAELRGLIGQLDPPLVLLEDLHWADESSHGVVLHLMRSARDDGHVLASALRPESIDTNPSLARLLSALSRERLGIDITLDPLDAAETAQMLAAIWGRQATEAEIEVLTRAGEGVPFFIEELSSSGPPGAATKIPKSVSQTVSSRVQSLGATGSQVLRTSSLMLGAIDPAVLLEATHLPSESVTENLVAAAAAGLIVDREGRLHFRHALVREAIAQELVSVEAARIHGLIASAIEAVHAAELDRHSIALAHHYTAAGSRDAAVRHWLTAGRRALTLAATEEARNAFDHGIQLSNGTSIEALQGLAEVEFREGHEEEAEKLFRSAADALRLEGDQVGAAKVLSRLAWTLLGRAQLQDALAPLDEALALLGGDSESLEHSRILIQKGNTLLFSFKEAGEAVPLFDRAREAAEAAGNQTLLAEALDGLAYAAQLHGRWEQASTRGAGACIAAKASGDPETIGRTHANRGVLLAMSGKPSDGIVVLDSARETLQLTYGRAGVGALDVTEAWIRRLMGLPRDVATFTARGHAAWQRWRGYRRVLEVWSALELGDWATARSSLTAFWEELGGKSARDRTMANPETAGQDMAHALHCETLVLLWDGNHSEAVRSAGALVEVDRSNNDDFDLAHSVSILCRALLLARQTHEADISLLELGELSRDFPYHRATLLELQGLRAQQVARTEDAVGLFLGAAQEFESCSNLSDRARCERLFAVASLERAPADRSVAVEALRSALARADKSGAQWERNQIESELRALGVRPRAGRPKRSDNDRELSPREAEVAVLVAAGVTNAEIARRVFLSERTVQDHIGNALRKLGLSGRAALASWAVKRGMI